MAALLVPAAGAAAADLTVYDAQHESLTQDWVDGLAKETGIEVVLRNANDTELGNQIVQEGAASPADVFITESSPAMVLVDRAVFLEAEAAGGRAVSALGPISVDDAGRAGRVRLMWRPEQFRLVPAEAPGAAPGVVAAAGFEGPAARLAVRLDAPTEAPVAVAVRGFEAPPPGARVGLAVDGPAHVLDR